MPTIEQIKTVAEAIPVIVAAVVGCVGAVSAVLAHLPLPAKWAEQFARTAAWASQRKFSVNQRDTLPKPEGQ
jgi:hypothetical protein